jgi:hypothetical protein
VADGEYQTAPFLRAAGEVGLLVVARLKPNLPRMVGGGPDAVPGNTARLERRDRPGAGRPVGCGGFRPLGDVALGQCAGPALPAGQARWAQRGCVLADRLPLGGDQHRGTLPDGQEPLGDENQGFNDEKTRYGLEHLAHRQPNSVLLGWLLTVLALTIERLYRLPYLRRVISCAETGDRLGAAPPADLGGAAVLRHQLTGPVAPGCFVRLSLLEPSVVAPQRTERGLSENALRRPMPLQGVPEAI